LTGDACSVLQTFYINLRDKYRSSESTPITTRQLESMIRLAEARARLELRETVDATDASDVVEIMKSGLFESATDDLGNIDFSRSQMGK